MDKDDILKELESGYEKAVKEFGVKASLDELDKAFAVRDGVLQHGFPAVNILGQVSSCIIDSFSRWNGYFHGTIMPNPHDLVSANESKFLSEDEKKEVLKMMSRVMVLVSKRSLAVAKKDDSVHADFIDESLEFWNNELQPFIVSVMGKVHEGWKVK